MRESHGISAEQAYKEYLKEKYCPKCKKVKTLACFARSQNPDAPFFSWCTDCNVDRNMKRALADSDFDTIQYLIVRLSFSDRCFICGLSHERSISRFGQALHVDHIHPHSDGGVLSLENAVLLCRSCNLSKMTKDLVGYLRDLGESDGNIERKMRYLKDRHKFARAELARISQRVYRDSIGSKIDAGD